MEFNYIAMYLDSRGEETPNHWMIETRTTFGMATREIQQFFIKFTLF